MNDIRLYWDKGLKTLNGWWGRSLVMIFVAVLACLFGMAWENKQITEDCRFMGVFRDGSQAYNCNLRVR